MSAFIVDHAHIDYLVTAAIEYGMGPRGNSVYWRRSDDWRDSIRVGIDTAEEVGAGLMRENIASVTHRYPDGDLPGPIPTPDPSAYSFMPVRPSTITAVQVLKAIACYEYQSCEHPGWRDSAAYDFCRRLENAVINRLPGYDDAKWELSTEDVTYATIYALRSR